MGHPTFRKKSGFWVSQKTEDRDRVVGWFILTAGFCGFVWEYFTLSYINYPYALLVFIGIWFIVRSLGIIEPSDTTLRLRQASLSKLGLAATSVHQSPQTFSTQGARQEARVMAGFFLILSTILLTGAFSVLFFWAPTYFFLVGGIGTALFLSWALYRRSANLLATGTALVTLLVITALQVVTTAADQTLVVGLVAGYLFLILGGVALLPRTGLHDQVVKVSLAGISIVYVATLLFLSSFPFATNWAIALTTLSVISASYALFAWVRTTRHSFAKHLLLVAIVGTALFSYSFLSLFTVSVLWFVLTLLAFGVGFGFPSYSARLLGIASGLVAILHYFLLVLPYPQSVGPAWLAGPLTLGLPLGIALVLLAYWYGSIPCRRVERHLLPLIREGFMVLGCFVLAASLFTEAGGVGQTVALILLGCGAVYASFHFRMRGLLTAAILILGGGLLQLLFIDAVTMSDTARFLSFASIAVVLLGLGLALEYYGYNLPTKHG